MGVRIRTQHRRRGTDARGRQISLATGAVSAVVVPQPPDRLRAASEAMSLGDCFQAASGFRSSDQRRSIVLSSDRQSPDVDREHAERFETRDLEDNLISSLGMRDRFASGQLSDPRYRPDQSQSNFDVVDGNVRHLVLKIDE